MRHLIWEIKLSINIDIGWHCDITILCNYQYTVTCLYSERFSFYFINFTYKFKMRRNFRSTRLNWYFTFLSILIKAKMFILFKHMDDSYFISKRSFLFYVISFPHPTSSISYIVRMNGAQKFHHKIYHATFPNKFLIEIIHWFYYAL